MAEFATLQHATYTEAEWTAWDGILLEGQMAFSSDVLYSGTDQMRHKVGNGTDTWTALDYVPEPIGFTGGNLTSALNEAKGSDIASASTTDIGAATGNFVHVTGTTTITALGTVQAGARRTVRFAGALTLTHNATSLILPTGANITTAANDVATFVSEGSGNWRCVNYMRASGKSIFDTISQVITNGVTDKAPSEDAVYNALALKKSSYYLDGAFTGNFAAPADSTTYYYLIRGVVAQLSVSTFGQPFLTTGTITTVAVHSLHTNNPTSESVLIYLRNDTTATDYTITLAWNDSYGASSSKSVIYTGLSIPVGNTTDKWVIKIITPAWVTNPTNWQWAWDFLIE